MDYKEYSRLRSIARKRIERASKAGKAEYTFIPTVAQVRASANPQQYMNLVKEFLNTPGSGLKWLDADKSISFPKIQFPPPPPVTKKTLSAEEKKERRRLQNKLSKTRARIRQTEPAEKAKRKASFLKGLQTLVNKWREVGIDAGSWLGTLGPKQLQAFADYVEYRFSQGDYSNKYVIDKFILDFDEMVKNKFNLNTIQSDFDTFLEHRKTLLANREETAEHGLTANEANQLWSKFVNRGV